MEIFDFIVPKDKTNPPADCNSFEKFLFQKKKIRWNCISRVRETWRIISTTFFPFHSLIHGSIVLSEKLRSYKFRSQNQLTASTTNRYFTGKIRNFCVYMNVIILTKKKLKRHLCFEGEMFEIWWKMNEIQKTKTKKSSGAGWSLDPRIVQSSSPIAPLNRPKSNPWVMQYSASSPVSPKQLWTA